MNKDFWHAKWQKNDIGFNQAQPNALLIRFFEKLNLKPHATVFVPLCGKSIDMLWLSEQGYSVIGVELNLEACRTFFIENQLPFEETSVESFTMLKGKNITLLSGDFFELHARLINSIDAVYDRAALVALPSEMRERYAEKIMQLISPNTQMLLVAASYPQSDMQGPPFSVDVQEIKRLYGQYATINVLYDEKVALIAPHLAAKGLKQAQEHVLHITF